ncbi:MAG: glycerate kinase [Coleofasciculaceae cyanobacterium]
MIQASLSQILNNWIAGETPSPAEYQFLAARTLAKSDRGEAFGITPDNVKEVIETRSHLFQAVYRDILSLPSFTTTFPNQQALISLWDLWLPLATQLASHRQQLGHPLIQGILGGQGTGKTTLANVLSWILAHLGYRTLSLSLDDLYKTYEEREKLREQDPRLILRGPPGTHDVELGLQLLDQLRQANRKTPILVPRFDKSIRNGAGDRTLSETVSDVDIVLFEGWFVGVRPINSAVFEGMTPAPIQTLTDRLFAHDMNERLKKYLPLWEKLDSLIILYPTDYRLSLKWRNQAEKQMIATGKSGMTDSQISDFVNYFWKSLHPELFIAPLTKNPTLVDLVIEINPDHTIGALYRPQES